MEYRRFGKTNKDIFVIGLGTYGLGGDYGPISKNYALKVIKRVIKGFSDNANLLIDTAPRYGNGEVEKWIGEIIREFSSKKILIATKGGRHIEPGRVNEKDFTPEFLKVDLENSLKRLRMEKIFLYQLHNPPLKIIEEDSIFELLEGFRSKESIDYYGISVDDPQEGIVAIDICFKKGHTGLGAIQVIYNILNKEAEEELFKKAKESEVAIIAREPLLRRFLTDRYFFDNLSPAMKKMIDLYSQEQLQRKIQKVKDVLLESKIWFPLAQVALKFVISNPNVTLTIPGTNRLEYIEQNLNASSIKLSKEILVQLKELYNLIEL